MRDYQQSKVYHWQSVILYPMDKSRVDFDQAHDLLYYVWRDEGLEYPPIIVPLAPNEKKASAKANRLKIWWPTNKSLPSFVLLHEVAHSMTTNYEGIGDRHGKDFVGVYMRLLNKHLRIPLPLLFYTAKVAGVEFDYQARIRAKDK